MYCKEKELIDFMENIVSQNACKNYLFCVKTMVFFFFFTNFLFLTVKFSIWRLNLLTSLRFFSQTNTVLYYYNHISVKWKDFIIYKLRLFLRQILKYFFFFLRWITFFSNSIPFKTPRNKYFVTFPPQSILRLFSRFTLFC